MSGDEGSFSNVAHGLTTPPSGSRVPLENQHGNTGRIAVATAEVNLPESYHFVGAANYGVWSFRIKHELQKDGLFFYCTTPPSSPMGTVEISERSRCMSVFMKNARMSGLKLLKRYNDPYELWTALKHRYESDQGPRRAQLIDRFFRLRKLESITMDEHLTEVKNISDMLEEVNCGLPEDIVVYYTLQNLPSQYDVFKRMHMSNLPTYDDLEAKLLGEEISLSWNAEEKQTEALMVSRNSYRRASPFRAGQSSSFGGTMGGSSYGGGMSYAHPNRSNNFGRNHHQPSNQNSQSFQPQGGRQQHYQPRYRPRGPENPRPEYCNFCFQRGHLERECDLKAMVDRVKDIEFRLQDKRKRALQG